MTSRVDLHIHTCISDGTHSPADVVAMARDIGLRVISITDHDAVDAVPDAQAVAEREGLRLVPGIELSCAFEQHDVHLLGYHLNIHHESLRMALERARHDRRARAVDIVDRLRSLGRSLSWERVSELAGAGVIGRPHIAQALVEAGYVGSVREAFERYLGEGCPAYVARFKQTPQDAIGVILAAGGVPVLAHPWGLERMVPSLVEAGLAGLEVYYAGYGTLVQKVLRDIAETYDLVCTGGSDFHGLAIMPDRPLGGAPVPSGVVEALAERHRALHLPG